MGFDVKEPILVIGAGGVGCRLALEAKDALDSDYLLISNNHEDLESGKDNAVHISTKPVINPSAQLIRGHTLERAGEIRDKISEFSTVVMLTNLAGKSGAAIAPAISKICKETKKNIISFVIMPFKYEKDRIFNSGVAIKRVQEDSGCTVVFDNDAILDSNPDLSVKECYKIGNSAIMHVISAIASSDIPSTTNIITTGRERKVLEDSLKDSIKMLYDNAPPNSIKRSLLYILGSENVPVGVINSITSLTEAVMEDSESRIDLSAKTSEESKIVMVSSVDGKTRFDRYDPLASIPKENTIDWSEPDCSFECKLDLYQLE